MSNSLSFRAGVLFVIDQIEHLKELDSYDNGCAALENAIQHLETYLTADAPKLLILPLRWERSELNGSWCLRGGKIELGLVCDSIHGGFRAIGGLNDFDYDAFYPTLAAAKAALEAEVLGLSAGDRT